MNKRIVVLGAGESGAGAAVLAEKEGFDVLSLTSLPSNLNIKSYWIVIIFVGKRDIIPSLKY